MMKMDRSLLKCSPFQQHTCIKTTAWRGKRMFLFLRGRFCLYLFFQIQNHDKYYFPQNKHSVIIFSTIQIQLYIMITYVTIRIKIFEYRLMYKVNKLIKSLLTLHTLINTGFFLNLKVPYQWSSVQAECCKRPV